MSASVLVVDDDEAVAEVMASLLEQAHYSAAVARNGTEALTLLRNGAFDAVISDIRMPPPDGLELLELLQSHWPDVAVLLVTAFATVPLAVNAMKKGAADFIMKPFDREQILTSLSNALERRASLRAVPPETPECSLGIVGECDAMRAILRGVETAAGSDAAVLIRGETGTGKGLVARGIHDASPRARRSFVKVQLSSLPDALIETELFGHDRGAVTGAAPPNPGGVRLADGGTLFLDDVGDASLPIQARLLRLLEDREFDRKGRAVRSRGDARVVAATSRDLEGLLSAGEWRQDLYYRLNVVPLVLPPLRERGNDVVLIARAVCSQLSRTNARPLVLDDDAAAALSTYHWPGNVRELVNLIERLALFSADGRIRLRALQHQFESSREPDSSSCYSERRRLLEREELADVLARTNGNRSQAARVLGISRRTPYSRLKAAGM